MNIAARIQQNGQLDNVQVSETVYRQVQVLEFTYIYILLKDIQNSFTFNEITKELKGIGVSNVYNLELNLTVPTFNLELFSKVFAYFFIPQPFVIF